MRNSDERLYQGYEGKYPSLPITPQRSRKVRESLRLLLRGVTVRLLSK